MVTELTLLEKILTIGIMLISGGTGWALKLHFGKQATQDKRIDKLEDKNAALRTDLQVLAVMAVKRDELEKVIRDLEDRIGGKMDKTNEKLDKQQEVLNSIFVKLSEKQDRD